MAGQARRSSIEGQGDRSKNGLARHAVPLGGLLLSALVCVALQPAAARQPAVSGADWSSYGGGPDGIRYSSLDQINRSNVNQLQVAWTFDASEGPGGTQTQPLVADGVLYTVTPKHNVVALDGATGKQLWKFESGVTGRGANRGVAFWSKGGEKRLFASVQHWLYALDATTGKPFPDFGVQGRIDLREGLGRDPAKQSILLTTPGVVYKDLLIVGGRTSEGLPATPGDIRAYDVRTGKTRWGFHTIPRPGEFGYKTWPKYAYKVAGSANNWAGMCVDVKRGLVFAPTGSSAMDFYGANRVGDNLFANSLVALDANTGKRKWHFQAVKHDIWDRDFPAPPVLVRVQRGSKWIDAVAQTTKSGHLYVFERSTGKSLHPIEYREYPASDVPGEVASKTQPLPTKPAPFSRQTVTEDMLTNRTPEARKAVLEKFRTFHVGGPFTPFRVDQETVIFPGFDGGAEWGGPAYDPESNLLYINANEMVWTSSLTKNNITKSGRQLYLQNCANCHGDTLAGSPPQMPSLLKMGPKWDLAAVSKITREGAGRMPSFPNLSPADVKAVSEYVLSRESKEIQPDEAAVTQLDYRFTGYKKFLDPDGYPAVAPPWGSLNAINLSTGEYAWKVPLGEYPELAAKGLKNTGSENYGGPVVTAGGLIFIAATNYDRKIRAFDKTNGKVLWEAELPFSANATPAVYSVGGRQFVVVCAEGAKSRPTDPKGSRFIAFALPTATGAVEGSAPPKAVVDGTGPGWRDLTSDDFTPANVDPETFKWSGNGFDCTGIPVGVTKSKKPYTNFELVARWRHLKDAGNSGIFLWGVEESINKLKRNQLPQGIEVQVLDSGYTARYERESGKKADWFTTHGDVFPTAGSKLTPFAPVSPDGSRSFPRKRLSRPTGEWNHYYVRAINGEVRLWVNGEEVSGGNNASPATGLLCFESEGSPVEFRDLRIRELP